MAEGGISSYNQDEPESVIISGVIDGVKQSFIDSGVDLDVLNKLQDLWVSKLKANSSQGLSIADVIQPAPVKKGGRKKILSKKPRVKVEGKKGNSQIKIEEEEDMQVVGGIDQDRGEKEKKFTESEEVIVISSDEENTGSISFKMPQVDGPADSSDDDGVDDDDDDGDDDDDDDDDDDNDPDGEDDEGVEEEPLGSEDDISDEDASDLFDTENVVVCQYDKITRARNKWKFHLKDGIMNLNGKDYVFQRANGEAEW